MKNIGVLAHPRRPQTAPLAHRIAETLRANGLGTWVYTQWDDLQVQADVRTADMVVAIGGDGAMLKAARVCAPYAVPVLGVNMGRLGFLTEVRTADDWAGALPRLLAGDFWIEQRMMMTAAIRRAGQIISSGDALNDVVISGNSVGHMVILDTYIDKHWTTTYNSDALIVATPTGSTAYALAAGGPILPPDLKNLLLVPTAPHLSMDRPIVLSEGAQVTVRTNEDNRNAVMVTIDGYAIGTLQERDRLLVRASAHSARFVRLRPQNYFYRSLLERLEPRVTRQPEDLSDEDDEP